MRILITSGGTKVAIDPVRHIGNKSTGRFGAALAEQALCANNEVIYLTSEDGKSPFFLQIDGLNQDADMTKAKNFYEFTQVHRKNYHEYRYQYFSDYAENLEKLILKFKPDVVMLAAAVSDYLVKDYSNEKIRSNTELTIALEKAPKIINHIKRWSPDVFLVGFKLLIDASDDELVSAARKTMDQSQADLVIANNLSSIEKGAHEVLLVEKNGEYTRVKQQLAEQVMKRILQR